MSLSELEHLRWQNAVFKEKQWASNPDRLKRSEWFFLINTRYKPALNDAIDIQRCEQYCDELMQEFAEAVRAGQVVTLNRKTHHWDGDFIREVRIRYVVELGKGKMKLDGTRGKSGGEIHIHGLLTIYHYSNLTLTWESLVEFFQPKMFPFFGKKPFISHPKLTQENRTKEYMEKGFEEAAWKVIEL